MPEYSPPNLDTQPYETIERIFDHLAPNDLAALMQCNKTLFLQAAGYNYRYGFSILEHALRAEIDPTPQGLYIQDPQLYFMASNIVLGQTLSETLQLTFTEQNTEFHLLNQSFKKWLDKLASYTHTKAQLKNDELSDLLIQKTRLANQYKNFSLFYAKTQNSSPNLANITFRNRMLNFWNNRIFYLIKEFNLKCLDYITRFTTRMLLDRKNNGNFLREKQQYLFVSPHWLGKILSIKKNRYIRFPHAYSNHIGFLPSSTSTSRIVNQSHSTEIISNPHLRIGHNNFFEFYILRNSQQKLDFLTKLSPLYRQQQHTFFVHIKTYPLLPLNALWLLWMTYGVYLFLEDINQNTPSEVSLMLLICLFDYLVLAPLAILSFIIQLGSLLLYDGPSSVYEYLQRYDVKSPDKIKEPSKINAYQAGRESMHGDMAYLKTFFEAAPYQHPNLYNLGQHDALIAHENRAKTSLSYYNLRNKQTNKYTTKLNLSPQLDTMRI